MEKANEYKDKGNDFFRNNNFEEAAKWFSEAINLDPNNQVLYSNRSACYVKMNKLPEALEDANKTISLKPDWSRGFSRKAAALHAMQNWPEAREAYMKGLELEPNNEQLKKGLTEVMQMMQGGDELMNMARRMMDIFKGDVVAKARSIPEVAPHLNETDFIERLHEIQANPNLLSKYLQEDERIKKFVIFSMDSLQDLFGANAGAGPMDAEPTTPAPQPAAQAPKAEPPKPAEKKSDEPELTPEQKQAVALKEKGNDAYKNKRFDEALNFYSQAIELDPQNMLLYTNKAAVFFEMGKFEDCVAACQKSIEIAEEMRSVPFKNVARAYARMGNAYLKQEKFAEAIKALDKSLLNDRTPATLELKNKAEKMKEDKEKREYINPELSLKAKTEGNDFFKKQMFPEAVKSYTEAIKRNPTDPVNYSNRAASYTKLMAYKEAIRDCDEAIKLDPKFIKAYIRKGHVYSLTKEYAKCLEVYEAGLKVEPENDELKAGIERTLMTINNQAQSGQSDEETLQKAMADPEIRQILTDPAMQKILQDMQTDPRAVQDHMSNPVVKAKINKLIAAGVIGVK
jgi:stress-induced-phosphoprotein 1